MVEFVGFLLFKKCIAVAGVIETENDLNDA
jgi:hypothetical protein